MVSKNSPAQKSCSLTPDPKVIAALSGEDADADRKLALRTRRAVYNAARASRTDRLEDQRNLFIALVVGCVLVMMLMPAIWSGLQEMISGATFTDLPVMLGALGMMLFAAIMAVLFLLGDNRRHSENDTRHARR